MLNGNWNVIYEAPGEAYGLMILTAVILILLLVCLAFIYKYRKKIDHKLKCFFIAFAAILLLRIVIPMLGLDNDSNKGTLYERYLAGDCLIVEGYIEGYETRNEWARSDIFYVNGVKFSVYELPSDIYGYRIRQINGGVLKNGEYVRIHYIEYRYTNVMMKLELKTTEAP